MNTIKLFCALLTLSFLMNISQAKAQDVSVLKLGTSTMDNQQWGELMYGAGNVFGGGFGILSPTLGIAGGLEFTTQEISPKISLGTTWGLIFTTSLNVNYYPKRAHRVVFTPEMGINVLKLIHVTYGYQFNQASLEEGRTDISKHRLSVFVTIPTFIH